MRRINCGQGTICTAVSLAVILTLFSIMLPAWLPALADFAPGAGAQSDAQAEEFPQVEAEEALGWMNTPGVSPDQVNEVAREIWCPLCSGVRLDSCELLACHQMKDVIALKLAEGEDSTYIKNYFLEQYGPQVLGEPPREGFNWLAWILPVVAVTGGGAFLWRQTRRLVRSSREEEEAAQDSAHDNSAHDNSAQNIGGETDGTLPQTDGQKADSGTRSTLPGPQSARTEAERRLEEELAKYG